MDKFVWIGFLLVAWAGAIALELYVILPGSWVGIGDLGLISAAAPVAFWPLYLLAALIPWRPFKVTIRGILVASILVVDLWGLSSLRR